MSGRLAAVAALGVSTDEICGVRDQAALLAEALEAQDVACSLHWLRRDAGSLRSERLQVESWAERLSNELRQESVQAILLHYSVFAQSHRGLPLFVGPVLASARDARVPIVTVLHEYAYPWRRDGLTGTAWAVSQRMRLHGVMRASAAGIVTTERRAEWLRSRRWLPKRRIEVAPVLSNLPPARALPVGAAASSPGRDSSPSDREASPPGRDVSHPGSEPHGVGLFGYAYDTTTVSLVLDALGLARERGLLLRLTLLGAPGERSPAGDRWRRLARERDLDEALSFSGTLPAQELSDRLAACEVLLFADPIGPTSRKTTLAASLAAGRPVIALDGPQRWAELAESEAALIVAPNADRLAGALGELLSDERRRRTLGARGRELAECAGARSARIVAELLAEVVVEGGVANEALDQAGARSSSRAERAIR